jgi:hypothetical protein
LALRRATGYADGKPAKKCPPYVPWLVGEKS